MAASTDDWIVIGVSGVTCGGKTMLSKALHDRYAGLSRVIMQDSYFLPESSDRHVRVEGMTHFNWDCLGALDMDRMRTDVNDALTSPPPSPHRKGVLLLDGFLLFVDPCLSQLCKRKYFFTLPQAACRKRRDARVYDPPDVPGYFEACVWPEYERSKRLAMQMNSDICFLDGQLPIDQHLTMVCEDIDKLLHQN
ncbi:nicotinamide riboside kinase 1 isoform X2 [Nilaparvata lugens]|uniref:nicotinamide riboside kinase 1 isoform X2 n=1 Tax=Nilaparvata lugens TaxID=108931 RepID=UPI000B98C04C|nr:nicotinamide riboside kinase 1 isoform X2 [Nilaparvata lugens]